MYTKGIMEAREGQLQEFLLDAGLVSRSQIDAVLRQAKGKPLSQALIESGVLGEEEVRRASAHALGIPYVVLSKEDIDPMALFLLPEALCRAHSVVVFHESGRGAEAALLDMADLPALQFLESRVKVLPRLTNRESLRRALLLYQKELKEKFGATLEGTAEGEKKFETLLSHAISQNASTIHLEPTDNGFRVRYRTRGTLREAMSLSKKTGESITAYLKELAGFDTVSLSQETRFKIDIQGERISVRAGIAPTVSGEKVILNLVPERLGRKGFTLESLGLHGDALERMSEVLQQKKGLIIVAGPEESGKTTTLYTLLDQLNYPELSLTSVEAEIAYRLPHVAQTQVRADFGLSAAAALRGVLRQDPDVVMVADVMESDVALLAVQAAKNRLVLIGMNSSSAAEAIEKLLSLGVPQTLLSQVLSVSMAQRLARKLCTEYREENHLSRTESGMFDGKADFGRVLAALKEEKVVPKTISWKDVPFYRAEACGRCQQGYLSAADSRGRTALFEVFNSDLEPVGLTLAEDGLFKAAQGLTSIEEVLRVLE